MRIAFYAPMKSPTHPVPSGDRLLARMFLAALRATGHRVELACTLRAYEGHGDAGRQRRIEQRARRLADRLVERYRAAPGTAPQLWFTYHLFHKAPDWIGPAVARALGIPYVVAEASLAPSQRHGPWHRGLAAATAAVRFADAVLELNPADEAGIRRVRRGARALDRLPPFLDVDALAAAARDEAAGTALRALDLPRGTPRLVAVAMMRPGYKVESYRLLATALGRLAALEWHLVVVGDGAARHEVEAAFAPFGAQRVRLVGRQDPAVVAALLATADLFVWPAVTESFGMSLIEAQAIGVPVIVGHTQGVADVVDHGRSGLVVPAQDAAAFAETVRALLADRERRRALAAGALAHARARHDLPAAAAALATILRRVVARRRSSPRPDARGPDARGPR